MIDFLFAVVAIGIGGAGEDAPAVAAPEGIPAPLKAEAPAAPASPAAPAAPASPEGADFDMSVVPAGLAAEPQTPSGKFTTAIEVRPILDATRGNWVAVREYEGRDYIYVTQVWSWRCGLAAMAISVNDGPLQDWPMPPCHKQFATPNAILNDDPTPMQTYPPGSVEKVTVQLVYDDLSMDRAEFARGQVLMP